MPNFNPINSKTQKQQGDFPDSQIIVNPKQNQFSKRRGKVSCYLLENKTKVKSCCVVTAASGYFPPVQTIFQTNQPKIH
jgi:hypothetical protein